MCSEDASKERWGRMAAMMHERKCSEHQVYSNLEVSSKSLKAVFVLWCCRSCTVDRWITELSAYCKWTPVEDEQTKEADLMSVIMLQRKAASRRAEVYSNNLQRTLCLLQSSPTVWVHHQDVLLDMWMNLKEIHIDFIEFLKTFSICNEQIQARISKQRLEGDGFGNNEMYTFELANLIIEYRSYDQLCHNSLWDIMDMIKSFLDIFIKITRREVDKVWLSESLKFYFF